MQAINFNSNLNSLSITSHLGVINKSKTNSSYISTDAYLDALSELNKTLDKWVLEIEKINDYIELNFPKTKKDAEELLESLVQLYGGLKIALNSLNNEDMRRAHGSRIGKIEEELNQIEEYINDLEIYRINRDSSLCELDDLLNEYI